MRKHNTVLSPLYLLDEHVYGSNAVMCTSLASTCAPACAPLIRPMGFLVELLSELLARDGGSTEAH